MAAELLSNYDFFVILDFKYGLNKHRIFRKDDNFTFTRILRMFVRKT